MALRLKKLGQPITVNCICPGLVESGLTPTLISITPQEYVTPKSTVVRAVVGFLGDDTPTGQVAECSIDKIHYREQLEWSDHAAEWLMSDNLETMIAKVFLARQAAQESVSAETVDGKP